MFHNDSNIFDENSTTSSLERLCEHLRICREFAKQSAQKLHTSLSANGTFATGLTAAAPVARNKRTKPAIDLSKLLQLPRGRREPLSNVLARGRRTPNPPANNRCSILPELILPRFGKLCQKKLSLLRPSLFGLFGVPIPNRRAEKNVVTARTVAKLNHAIPCHPRPSAVYPQRECEAKSTPNRARARSEIEV